MLNSFYIATIIFVFASTYLLFYRSVPIFSLASQSLILSYFTLIAPFILSSELPEVNVCLFAAAVIPVFLFFNARNSSTYNKLFMFDGFSNFFKLSKYKIVLLSFIFYFALVFGYSLNLLAIFIIFSLFLSGRYFLFYIFTFFYLLVVIVQIGDEFNRRIIVEGMMIFIILSFFVLKKVSLVNILMVFSLPFVLFVFAFLVYLRSGFEFGDAIYSISVVDTLTFLSLVDVGVYTQGLIDFAYSEVARDAFRNNYLTGFSFERVIYLIVPRDLWPDKPEIAPVYLANYMYQVHGYGTTSYALGLPFEFFLNFGYFSMFILPFMRSSGIFQDLHTRSKRLSLK